MSQRRAWDKITLDFAPRSKQTAGTEANPSEISRNSPKIKEQFSEIPSYFSELNTSVPTSSLFLSAKCFGIYLFLNNAFNSLIK